MLRVYYSAYPNIAKDLPFSEHEFMLTGEWSGTREDQRDVEKCRYFIGADIQWKPVF
jgi:hypothetical protein